MKYITLSNIKNHRNNSAYCAIHKTIKEPVRRFHINSMGRTVSTDSVSTHMYFINDKTEMRIIYNITVLVIYKKIKEKVKG